VKELRGDRRIQCHVLVALAECRNHRKWFADFARPYLGDHPIEIGSGLGDYAREWIPLTEHFTVTDADESLVIGLKKEMAGHSNVDVRQVLLPSTARAALTIGPLAVAVRDPVMVAMGVGSLAELTGRTVNVALGSSSPVVVEQWHGRRSERTATALAESAAAVLAEAGFSVTVPDGSLCCGLTWISTGQLGGARARLRATVGGLAGYAEQGMTIVGLEPSCTAVLRGDLFDAQAAGFLQVERRAAEEPVRAVLGDEAVAPPRERFDVARGLGDIAERAAKLADRRIEARIEVHHALRPE